MRWLLLPLLAIALLAPVETCPEHLLIQGPERRYVPPVPVATPGAPWGADAAGRDMGCLMSRGLGRSLEIGFVALLLGVPFGLLLGLLFGWRGLSLGIAGEIFILAGLLLLFGAEVYRLALALGVALFIGRAVATRVHAVLVEPYIEGARALGGGGVHILRAHVLPHLLPLLPGTLAVGFGMTFLWMAELAVLGFHDRGVFSIDFAGGPAPVSAVRFFAADPDLGQFIGWARYEWLYYADQLFLPALLLVVLYLAFGDLGRALGKEEHSS